MSWGNGGGREGLIWGGESGVAEQVEWLLLGMWFNLCYYSTCY